MAKLHREQPHDSGRHKRAPRFYVYKLTTDSGGAPHIKRGLLSLAICKPSIRRTAQEDDWIFGFGGKALGERLIYIAHVMRRLESGSYYIDRAYQGRDDRIYRSNGENFVVRNRAKYHRHGDQLEHDLGRPPEYRSADVLLSTDFRYWGKNGSADYKELFPKVASLLKRLHRGHRVNISEAERIELLHLQHSEWRAHPGKRKLGPPSQTDYRKLCNHSEGSVAVPESDE